MLAAPGTQLWVGGCSTTRPSAGLPIQEGDGGRSGGSARMQLGGDRGQDPTPSQRRGSCLQSGSPRPPPWPLRNRFHVCREPRARGDFSPNNRRPGPAPCQPAHDGATRATGSSLSCSPPQKETPPPPRVLPGVARGRGTGHPTHPTRSKPSFPTRAADVVHGRASEGPSPASQHLGDNFEGCARPGCAPTSSLFHPHPPNAAHPSPRAWP